MNFFRLNNHQFPNAVAANYLGRFFDKVKKLLFDGEIMPGDTQVELPQNNREPLTRPKLKRLIFEYLQARNRKDILDDIPCEENASWND